MSSASSCDVLIVGAGPAGSAAARTLAASGYRVIIVDERTFPRDKVCGDGLVSDALNALACLGIREAVQQEAWHGGELRLYAPSGRHIALRGTFSCLPRERFDTILLHAACDAGAAFVHGTARAPLLDGDRVVGAQLVHRDGESRIAARVTLLATGANVTVLQAFGLHVTSKPNAVAGRAYYEAPAGLADDLNHLTIAYDRRWCPGYGWIFPGPRNHFNIGVGLFADRVAHGRLHLFFESFCRSFPVARRLVERSIVVRQFRGAPIRSGLQQASFGRPGLLAAGEAAATTYAATGEGIGKAMESGILAANVIDEAFRDGGTAEDLADAYRTEFRRRFMNRYQAYDIAQRWSSSPAMLNLLAWRANAGRFVQGELEALIEERGDATALFSTRGLLKALFR